MADEPPSWYVSGSTKLASKPAPTVTTQNDDMNTSQSGEILSTTPLQYREDRLRGDFDTLDDPPAWFSSGKAKLAGDGKTKSYSSIPRQAEREDAKASQSGSKKLSISTSKSERDPMIPKDNTTKSRGSRGSSVSPSDGQRCCGLLFGHRERIIILVVILVALLVIEIINLTKKHSISSDLGLVPREINNIQHVLVFVFFHGSMQHLIFNAICVGVMGFYLLLRGPTMLIGGLVQWLLGGLLIWAAGMPWKHVGFDVITAGMASYCITSGLKEKKPASVIMGVTCIVGSIILMLAVLKKMHGLQWDSLVAGAIVGVLQFLFRYWGRRACGPCCGDKSVV
eukprot:c52859_g1_i1.p1 GENE.c52859_g1_i1~~c52859_g1_i1.p1  ORF type:complete len:339 (-),score=59.57 c52859_g1_i1:49-1065(-)